MPFINGFLIGFAMIVFVGPVLFTILQIALEKGVYAGLSVAFGVFISDVVCVILCYYSSDLFLKNSISDLWLTILGVIILVSIGLKYLIKPNLTVENINKASVASLLGSFTKGFLINFFNPFVFAVWLTVIEIAKKEYQEFDLWIYLIAATFAVLITDSVKAIFAKKLHPLLKPKVLNKIYRLIGIILILFSFRLIFHLFN